MAKYKYTKEEDNIIRRINRLLERSIDAFGVGSDFVSKQKTLMYNELIPGRTPREAFNMKNGKILLSRSTKNPLKYTKEELLEFEKKLKERSDIAKERQRIYDYYKDVTGEKPTRADIRKTSEFLYSRFLSYDQALQYLYKIKDEEPDATKLVNEAKSKGKKSKAVIDRIINETNMIRERRGPKDKYREDSPNEWKDPFEDEPPKPTTTYTTKSGDVEIDPSDYRSLSKILDEMPNTPW